MQFQKSKVTFGRYSVGDFTDDKKTRVVVKLSKPWYEGDILKQYMWTKFNYTSKVNGNRMQGHLR